MMIIDFIGVGIIVIIGVVVEIKFVKNKYRKTIKDITQECKTSINSIQKCVESNGGSLKKCSHKKG